MSRYWLSVLQIVGSKEFEKLGQTGAFLVHSAISKTKKLMDLAQGHHDFYTNLCNWPSLKILRGSTGTVINCNNYCIYPDVKVEYQCRNSSLSGCCGCGSNI